MQDTPTLHWRLLHPAGLALICGGEFLITFGLKGLLGLENKTLLLIGLSVGGAVLTTMLFYLISWALTVVLYLAPDQKAGVTLLAGTYGGVKLLWLLGDLITGDWSGLMVSLLFIAIVAYVLCDALMGKLHTTASFS
jgi:hypothetical protein